MRRVGWVVLAAALTGGCFRTTVRSGQPPWHSPESHYEKWHSGYLIGIVEGSGPYDLNRVCPDGWAEVETEMDPFQSYLGIQTLGIYAPQSATIACTAPGAPAAPPAQGYDPSGAGEPAFPPPAPSTEGF